ncbi:hypothetical protein JRC04_14400 [Mycolicibacterium sp. S2-37]|uniref:hypothetical protein n=1 Tax=Mycolicibacterium sp. S2-37 TaxID=2810297 RepID=UPI001A940E0C|nr:hypothetical protein [Mycolicibacterium sp. S2-37]MBO0678657.1 hypothetical protein [Mycolicibacterium sp. S2-37]
MPSSRIALLRLSAGAAACTALIAVGAAPSAAAPASDSQGFVDSTARCAAPATAVAFGRTATSRIAICESADGDYTYRGVRVRDGAKLILAAESAGGGVYTAVNDGVTYTVSADDLTVSAGDTVIREEPMLEFHGPAATGSADAPASSAPTPADPTPTTPLGPPLPAEVGGSES